MVKIIRLPYDLKARVKRLASLNIITPSEMVRYAIQAKLSDCKTGRMPANTADGQKEK